MDALPEFVTRDAPRAFSGELRYQFALHLSLRQKQTI